MEDDEAPNLCPLALRFPLPPHTQRTTDSDDDARQHRRHPLPSRCRPFEPAYSATTSAAVDTFFTRLVFGDDDDEISDSTCGSFSTTSSSSAIIVASGCLPIHPGRCSWSAAAAAALTPRVQLDATATARGTERSVGGAPFFSSSSHLVDDELEAARGWGARGAGSGGFGRARVAGDVDEVGLLPGSWRRRQG